MFFVRAAFWLAVLAFLLPAGPRSMSGTDLMLPAGLNAASQDMPAEPAPEVGIGDLMQAAGSTARDVMGFCERNPATCETGSAAVTHIQNQLAYYGGMALDWLNARRAEAGEPAHDVPAVPQPAPRSEASA